MTGRYPPVVPAEDLASPSSYRQLRRHAEDEAFRREIEALVERVCRGDRSLLDGFVSLSRDLATDGAVSFGGLLPGPRFDEARRPYDAAMLADGSRGSLHSYLNLADSRRLLRNPAVWEAVAHPLLVALVAHALGGPVGIVDLRGKDTQPVEVVARDNTLHLDNNPFMDEFKVILTWTLGTGRGPTGQGLTYLPRTNRLFRQCRVEADGEVWSDEDDCIFPSRSRVDEVLAAQARFFDDETPRVVHLKDTDAPTHTVFAASRLVHHRYRTSTGAARSAIMTTFHRLDEGTATIGVGNAGATELHRFLVTGNAGNAGNAGHAGRGFLDVLADEAPSIVQALGAAVSRPGVLIDTDRHLLRGEEFRAWYARQSEGVSLHKLRAASLARSLTDGVPAAERLVQRMQYDLQGPLSLPLYADLREESRKRARIVIRELPPERIAGIVARRLADGDAEALLRREPAAADRPLHPYAERLHADLAALCDLVSRAPTSGRVDAVWGSTDEPNAAASLRRFLVDLRLTASRVTDDDSLTTASVFGAAAAAVACDLFLLGDDGAEITSRLFDSYVSLVSASLVGT